MRCVPPEGFEPSAHGVKAQDVAITPERRIGSRARTYASPRYEQGALTSLAIPTYRLRELNSAQRPYQSLRINQISNRLEVLRTCGRRTSRTPWFSGHVPLSRRSPSPSGFISHCSLPERTPQSSLALPERGYPGLCWGWERRGRPLPCLEDDARVELARVSPTNFPSWRNRPLCESSIERWGQLIPYQPDGSGERLIRGHSS